VQSVKGVTKAPTRPSLEPAHNYSGCFVGGYFGGSAAHSIGATDPASTGGTFYNAPFANAGNGGQYNVPFKFSPTGGGTLGCNWQSMGSHIVFGAEGESGFMRLRATASDPYSAPFNDDTVSTTTIGNWFGAITGRAGWATDRALFYAKTGAGFTALKSSVVDGCSAAPCGTGLLNATNRNSVHAFWVAGGGIEWAWTGNWTVKTEYLYLGLNETYSVCGPGGGGVAGSAFCSGHSLSGVHTGKIGLNYKIL
jgi:outer membrane immunogenic protein